MRPDLTHFGGSIRLGDLIVSLSDAEWLTDVISEEVISAGIAGLSKVEHMRQGIAAMRATKAAKDWRRAAGWLSPYDADRKVTT